MHPIVVQACNGIGIAQCQVDVQGDDAGEFLYGRSLSLGNVIHSAGKFLGHFDDNEHQNFLLGGDMVVQAGCFNIERLRQVTHGNGTVAPLPKQLGCNGEDFGFAVGFFHGCKHSILQRLTELRNQIATNLLNLFKNWEICIFISVTGEIRLKGYSR